jgi:cytochrome P450
MSRLLVVGGHDTTAATFTWLFWELAKHPRTQERIRAEIREARQRIGSREFSGSDYDSLTFLNASLKVKLELCTQYASWQPIILNTRKPCVFIPFSIP